jgi:glycosyltransferase involved in cell wall biosynthesis
MTPAFIAKLFRRPSTLILAGHPSTIARARKDALLVFLGALSRFNFCLATTIVAYSQRAIPERNLQGFGSKVVVANRHFVDTAYFAQRKPLSERAQIIGFIGRLSGERGIMEFVHALPSLAEDAGATLRFFIGGAGELENDVIAFIDAAHARLS